MNSFKDLELSPDIQKALDELGFTKPTEIQAQAIPQLLAHASIDFHGQAQTGTGKTLAFGIPLMKRIDRNTLKPQAIVVAPTRELAVQIYESLNAIARKIGIKLAVIYGGASMEEQLKALKKGVHIIIGTPGRIIDHLKRKTLSLDDIHTLVLDEADIMLDMGFRDEIEDIMRFCPKDREIWLFSATVKQGISDIMKTHMKKPISVRVSRQKIGTEQTKQYYCLVPVKSRLHAITRFIQADPDFYGIIFCQTKKLAQDLSDDLIKRGYNVGALHGDLSQAARNKVIKKFKDQELSVMVATDVAARGIDVANLTHVINYSLPEDLESYVHRVGRTGRAGKEGTAISFITQSGIRIVHHLEKLYGVKINPIDVPSRDLLIKSRIEAARNFLETLPDTIPHQYQECAELAKALDTEKAHIALAKLLYDKFMSSLDLTEIPKIGDTTTEVQEICINMGLEDGIEQEDIIQYLNKAGLSSKEVKSIRVIKRRSFVKLHGDCTPDMLAMLRKTLLAGRKAHVTLSTDIEDDEMRRRRGGPSGRPGGDRRRMGMGRRPGGRPPRGR